MVPFREITLTKQQRLKIKDFLNKSNEKRKSAMLFGNIIGDIDRASLAVYYLEEDYANQLADFAKKLYEEMKKDRGYQRRICGVQYK